MHTFCIRNFKTTIERKWILPSIICLVNNRCIHTGGTLHHFYQPYKGYFKKYAKKELTLKEKWEAFKMFGPALKEQLKIAKEELKEWSHLDPPIARPGDSEYVFRFNNKEILKNFIVTSDKDNNDGFSECELFINEKGKGVFKGTLSNQLPNDGVIKRTGYCNLTSRRPMKSFWRKSYFQWFQYNHLVMKVRGDGRSYMINISCEGDFDVTWNDMWNYCLFTRGGPYWQIVKIPFSKFYFVNKGRVLDCQERLPLAHITNFGISCADKVPGPFQLEIDYVAIYFDPSHTEEFAYELYQVPKYTIV